MIILVTVIVGLIIKSLTLAFLLYLMGIIPDEMIENIGYKKIIGFIVGVILAMLILGFLPIFDCGYKLAYYHCSAYSFLPW